MLLRRFNAMLDRIIHSLNGYVIVVNEEVRDTLARWGAPRIERSKRVNKIEIIEYGVWQSLWCDFVNVLGA